MGSEYTTRDKAICDLVMLLGGVFMHIVTGNMCRKNNDACCGGSVWTEKLKEILP